MKPENGSGSCPKGSKHAVECMQDEEVQYIGVNVSASNVIPNVPLRGSSGPRKGRYTAQESMIVCVYTCFLEHYVRLCQCF